MWESEAAGEDSQGSLWCVKFTCSLRQGKDVHPSDEFSFAHEFTSKLRRIKINSIQMKETPQEQSSTLEKVYVDRNHQLDAVIVRIMKTRNVITHSNLVSELFSLVKFPVTQVDVKKRVESLIDREYMERDSKEVGTYLYMA